MFIELQLDEGPVILNANNIVKICIGDPEKLNQPESKYNYIQKINILTIDGSTHSITFESIDDDVTSCFDFFNEIKDVLNPIEIYEY